MSSADVPNVDIDEFMSSSNAGIAALTTNLKNRRAFTEEAKVSCSQCSKQESTTPLQSCSRCRSVRYCSKECQIRHFKSTHKMDCENFRDPPLCRAFNYRIILPGSQYPEIPIFARGHSNGMGAWVSTAGSIDCRLATIPGGIESYTRRDDSDTTPSIEHIMNMIPGLKDGKYLSFTVLVQNRMKQSIPMVVVGKATVGVGTREGSPIIRQGKETWEPNVNLDIPNLGSVVGIPTVWVKLTHLNGKEVKDSSRFPEIKDTQLCAVVLRPGDYAIFTIEFRCGGPNVSLDFHSIRLLHHLRIPAVPYDPEFKGSYKELVPKAAERDEVCEIHAIIDREAVDAWYKDYERGGEEAYIASHYGAARAGMIRSSNDALKAHVGLIQRLFQ